MSASPPREDLVADLAGIQPGLFHRGPEGDELWRGLAEGPLRALYKAVTPGMRTLETGCGATTVVFAAAGARHTTVTPSADEEQRVRDRCAERGISVESVDFLIGSSDRVLVNFSEPIDLMLIDGAHRFPFPVLDWHYGAATNLKIGGELWVDDVSIPSVYHLFEFLKGEPEWQLLEVHDDKIARFRKLTDPVYDSTRDWELQEFNRPWKWVFSHIPLRRRWRKLRQRVMLRTRLRMMRSRRQTAGARQA